MTAILQVAAREDLYGASRAALAIARHLPGHGFSSLLVSPANGPLQAAWRQLEAETFVAPVGGGRSMFSRLTRRFALAAATDWARAREVRAVAAITLSAVPAARQLATALGVPLIAHLRNIYASRGRESPFTKYGAQHAALVIAASQFILDEYRSSGARPDEQRAVVVIDGVDPAPTIPRAEARKRLDLDESARYLVTAGAIAEQKGTLFAAQILGSLDGVELVVLGGGEGAYADRVRAVPKVRALGFRADGPELLSAFDVFLHPSRAEALGLAPVEALAAGVPVVAANVGGLPEALGDAAVLLPPEDGALWAAAIRRLLEDTEYKAEMIARGLIQAKERSAALAAERTAAEYRALLEGA